MQPRKSKKRRRAVATFALNEREQSLNTIALQHRTTFHYKTPAQRRVTGNATSIPRPNYKKFDTSEAPTQRGKGVRGELG